ncbi:hypothetical protein GE107_20015 [Cohnella sp. CFH 77786]|uniref:hypothetical protein n=1 Tax=Cohnella sp. CFH 77786 TaxID=2662265 RepID=UPI001C60A8D3|nr:hypothetical protein [Cohnella sp. CFH 77786]MBW5448332.1 hypothetical protein [Cohnella sp. CFH 77786]
MDMAPVAPLVSFMLMMLVVVATGTAWFVALHPRFIWRMLHGSGVSGDPPASYSQMIRLGGLIFGAAGMDLLLASDLFS